MRKVVFSKTAATRLDHLLEYLESEWSERVKQNFIDKLVKSLVQISKYPNSCERSGIKQNLYRCVVSRQTTLYYTFDHHKIFVVALFDNRMNPKKLKEEANKK